MKTFKVGNRIICLSLALIILLIVSITLLGTLFNVSVSDIVSKSELNNVEKILENLPSATQDISALNTVADIAGGISDKKTIKRYTTLKDVDNDNDYLYTEFNEGGYAIYDRIGEFLYERSDYGNGPYSSVFDSKDIYYGGPTYYYIKKNNVFYSIGNTERATYTDMLEFNKGIEDVRQQYLDGDKTALSVNGLNSTAGSYFVGEDLEDTDLNISARLYFSIFEMLYKFQYDTGATHQIYGDNIEVPIDVDCGDNKYGSCVYVAFGLALKYYETLGVKTIPDDISSFNDLLYDYKITSSNECLAKYFGAGKPLNGKTYYTGLLSNIDKNLLRTERVHQELLWHAFPEYHDKNNKGFQSSGFGSFLTDCEKTYNSYANTYGLPKYKFFYDLGTIFYPEKLFSGNPCVVGIKKGAPRPDKPDLTLDGNHAVLGYGYTGTRNVITTVNEIICNYGWQSATRNCTMYINSSFVTDNICMAGFKWR